MNDGNAEQSNESVASSDNATSENATGRSAKPASIADQVPPPAAATPAVGASSKEKGGLRKFFWLDERVAEASKKGFSKGHPGWPDYDLARQARSGIVQIGETGEGNGAVLILERAEVIFLLRAYCKRHGLGSIGSSLSDSDWEAVRKIPPVTEAWAELSGGQQQALLAGLGPDAEQALVNEDIKQRRHLASALRKMATALSDPLERDASLLGRVLFMRWARIGGAVLVVLAVVWAIWGVVDKQFAKPNIALGRPVTISSQYGDVATDHTLLVDGDKTNLGFHTENGPNQWVTIDLGSPKSISKVVVYNRAECCQERAIPLRLEVSDDGTNYRKVADRTEEFDVWTAKGFSEKARYVRLRHLGSNFLHLSEVEIY
ncbi:MAG TPA: discoidin domain-containing protein [Polyangiaceae bacterium]|nr:discoidin domain-containing protein [Polyangiaceae bacterium]